MHSILIISIAVAANLDNLGVGIAYGIQKIKISHIANLIIALISFAATWLSAEAGTAISRCLSKDTAHGFGAALLLGVGLWVFAQPIVAAAKKKKPIVDFHINKTRIYIGPSEILAYPERADLDNSRDTGHWEAVLLGVALSINAIVGGFDAGVVGVSALLESILVGAFSFITILAGCCLGKKYAAQRLGGYATLISGTLLVLIGLHQLLG